MVAILRPALCVLSVALVSVACRAGPDIPDLRSMDSAAAGSPMPSGASPPTATSHPSPVAGADVDLAAFHWYESSRWFDQQGNSWNTLLIGSLDGWAYGDILLGERAFPESHDGLDAFAWTDPKADGIFGGHVLVWGRDERGADIESVDVTDATIAPLVDADGTVHVATADASLSNVFFITVNEDSNQPTGLWVDRVEDKLSPTELNYQFETLR